MVMKNMDLQGECDLYPSIISAIAKREALACSDHSMTVRCYKHGVKSSLTGFHFEPDSDDGRSRFS